MQLHDTRQLPARAVCVSAAGWGAKDGIQVFERTLTPTTDLICSCALLYAAAQRKAASGKGRISKRQRGWMGSPSLGRWGAKGGLDDMFSDEYGNEDTDDDEEDEDDEDEGDDGGEGVGDQRSDGRELDGMTDISGADGIGESKLDEALRRSG